MAEYVVIYMAAGNSRRFGSNKLLYCMEGKPLYRHGLDMLLEFTKWRENIRLLVVTQYEEILEEAGRLAHGRGNVKAVHNPDSKMGASYTIRRGIQEAEKWGAFDYLIFVAADQPWLSRSTMEKFVEAGDRFCHKTVSASWKGTAGNPVMFAKSLVPELMALEGDVGGRRVWREHSEEGGLVETASQKELEDVDVKK